MSAWDRGRVFSNDVGLQPARADGSRDAAQAGTNEASNLLQFANIANAAFNDAEMNDLASKFTPEAMRRHLFEFLRNFVERGGVYTYRNLLQEASAATTSAERAITVDFNDLRSFDPEIASLLQLAPSAVIPQVCVCVRCYAEPRCLRDVLLLG